MNTYFVGELVQLSVTFKDQNNNLVDPSTVAGSIRTPDGVVSPLTVAKISLGVWGAQFTPAKNGVHQYKFAGTGAFVGASEASFMAQTMFP